jgi:hypothetical protein
MNKLTDSLSSIRVMFALRALKQQNPNYGTAEMNKDF